MDGRPRSYCSLFFFTCYKVAIYRAQKLTLVLDWLILFSNPFFTNIWFQKIPWEIWQSSLYLLQISFISSVKWSSVVCCKMSTLDLHMNLTHLIFLGQLALFKRKFECGKYRDSISNKLSEEFNGISTDYCHRICVETRLISPQLAQVFQLFCLS